MAMEPTYPTKKLVAMTPEMAERIEAFRFDKRVKSESEAIRMLIAMGLEAGKGGKPAAKPRARKAASA